MSRIATTNNNVPKNSVTIVVDPFSVMVFFAACATAACRWARKMAISHIFEFKTGDAAMRVTLIRSANLLKLIDCIASVGHGGGPFGAGKQLHVPW